MKRIYASVIFVAVAALGGWVSLANAAPPTVTPSPGYDARLQEQRAKRSTYEPVLHSPRPSSRRHVKKSHDGAY